MNPDQTLTVATVDAHAAGEILKRRFKTTLNVKTKSSERDLVTDVDHEAQEVIVKIIQEKFPTHRFPTEEVGTEKLGDPHSPYLWIVDPLDGTKEFLKGNYKLDVDFKDEAEAKESGATVEFEKKALSRLGGSICFVSRKGFLWKGENRDGACA